MLTDAYTQRERGWGGREWGWEMKETGQTQPNWWTKWREVPVPHNCLWSKFNRNGWITGSFVSFFFHSPYKGHHCNCQTHLHVVILHCLNSLSLCYCCFRPTELSHNADMQECEIKWGRRLWIYTFVALMDNTCVLLSPVSYKLEWSRWMGTKEATQWCDWGQRKVPGRMSAHCQSRICPNTSKHLLWF